MQQRESCYVIMFSTVKIATSSRIVIGVIYFCNTTERLLKGILLGRYLDRYGKVELFSEG